MQIPIACSLEPSAAEAQLGEWRQLLGPVDHRDRVAPERLELRLLPEADIAKVIQLAQREMACCPFFTFTLEIRLDRLILAVEVPNDAVEVFDGLMTHARPN